MVFFVDDAINIITGIWDIITGVVTGGAEFIIGSFSIIGTILTIIYNIFLVLEVFVYIIFNPYLLLSFLLGTGLYYAALTAHSRKELVINLTTFYYKLLAEWIPNMVKTMYEIALHFCSVFINVIVSIINGILSMI